MLIDRGVLRATKASRWEVATLGRRRRCAALDPGADRRPAGRLPDEEKAVLQDAAVVGREFWLGAVVRLSGRPPGVIREVLGRLRIKELVVPHEPSSFSDESEFSFRHLLIRDGAYDSLPKALRASKHARIAEWAAERAGDRADEVALLIATHRPGGAPVPGGARRHGTGAAGGRARRLSLVADGRRSGDGAVAAVRRRSAGTRRRSPWPIWWTLRSRTGRRRTLAHRGVLRLGVDERERGVVPSVPRPGRGGRRRARCRMGAGGACPDRVPRGTRPRDPRAFRRSRPATRTSGGRAGARVRPERRRVVPVAAGPVRGG